ncbi:MAG: beta strand repeat-containing protein [Janthinobacterium lividum]
MQKNLPANRLSRWLAGAFLVLLTTVSAQAQLTGAKTIPGSYASLAAAITDLNTQGVGAGGVTFNLAAGYAETFASPTAGAITATGTSANPIVFQKSGTGANPLITAGVGTSTTADAIISLAGSDFVTFNGIDLVDPTSNATAATAMEFGFLLGRNGTGATLDGTNSNAIRNSTITLQRAYTSTTNNTPYGIFATAGTVAVPFTALSATGATAAGQSSGNTFASNTIQNANGGIYLQGLADATPYANYDQNNTVGGSTAATGNTIQNYGGAATQAYGIRLQYQNNVVTTYNTVANAANGGVASANTLYGIYVQSGTNTSSQLNRNTITLVQAANNSQVAGIYNATGGTGVLIIDFNTFNLTSTASTGSFYNCYNSGSFSTTGSPVFSFSSNTISHTSTGAATNTFYALYNSGTIAGTSNFNGNQFLNAANTVASTGTLGFIYNTNSSTGQINLQNNQWTLNRTAASGSVYGYYNASVPTGTDVFSGNNFSNITLAGSSAFYGFYVLTSTSQLQTITGNTMTNIVGGSGNTAALYMSYGASGSVISGNTVNGISGAGTTYGIYTGTSFYGGNITGNTVGNVSSSGASSTAYGIALGSNVAAPAAVNLYANKVYGIASSGATGQAYGVYVSSTGAFNIYNNLVGNITAPVSASSPATAGLYISTGTTVNAYYNSIYLTGTSSASGFGSAGIYAVATPTLTLINNLVVNTSVATGSGIVAAYRRSSATLTTYATASNNNLFYAGTPGASQVIFTDGTSSYQTLAAYKAAMATRDQASVTELPTFASTNGPDATFLHLAVGTATQAESGGTPVAGITTDYDGDTRNATTPDIGADEGAFTPNDQTPPAITYTALGNTGSSTSRTIVATIIDPSGIATGAGAPRIYYKLSTATTYFSAVATSVAGSTYTFTIDYANIGGLPAAGSTIQYYVAAQDASPASNTSTSPIGGAGTNPPGSTAPATPNSYQLLPALTGTYYVTATVGSSPTPAKEFATLTAAAAAYNTSGLGGAVTFVLLDASYGASETFPIALNSNPDASATNTLTIRPGTGVSPIITGSVAAGAVLKLNGADYVTINGSNAGTTTQNLTITNTSATGSGNAVLWIAAASATDGATNNAVRNTILTGSTTAGSPQFVVFLGGGGAGVASPTTSTSAPNSNNTLSNNLITRGFYGVFVFGVSATSLDQSNAITGNQIGQVAAGTGFGQEGVRVVYQQGLTLTGNDIQNITSSTAASNLYGIFLADSKGSVVSRNSVHGISYTGVSTTKVWAINTSITAFNTAANASANRFDNNLVYGITSTATSSTWNTVGIDLVGGYGDQLVYNTVYLSGQLSAAGGTAGSAAFANGNPSGGAGATNIDVRNNIFSIIGGTGGTATTPLYANYNYGANYTGSTLNYNDLYVSAGATGLPVIGHLGTSTSPTGDYATLAAWQAAISQEANSVSVDPQFVQTTTTPYNLTPSNAALNNTGTPISGVTTDYTGATRGTTPDIGGIEFTPLSNDLAAAALVAPATSSTCYSTAEPVSVSIRNAGTATLSFATTAATVTVVVTLPGGGTQTFTTTLNTGTLPSNATQTVVLPGTLNMSTVGTYTFAITATVAGDGNTTNDLLAPAPTRTVAAPVAGTLSPAATTICVSGTAALTLTGAANGSIQFQSSTDNVTFTDIAGATSATYTTPVLTATTYYRAQVRCNTGTATSNVSTITVNNPLVATTNTPVTICAGSTATLTATASAGSAVRFFSAATSGTALATAGTYTTPALTANTTYYVEAFAPSTSVAGLADNSAANGTFAQSTFTDYPLGFAVSQAGTLASVDVYPTATGTLTIRLYSVSGTQPAGTATAVAGSDVTITVTTAQVGTKVTVPLNYALTAGDYKLSNFAGGLGRYSTYTGTYPLTSADGTLTVKGSYTLYSSTSYSNTTYNSFFNLTFSGECVGATRTPIQVNVTQPATASFPAATASTCGASPYQLAGTVTGSATTGTYTTSGTGTFAPNATTLTATYTPSAADITAGSVTITLTSAAATPCAATTATLALSIGRPAVATFSYPATGGNCAGSTGTVTPTLATGATAGTYTSTTGLTINATTGVVNLATSTAGTYTVTNTVAASGACAAATATATITVNPTPARPTITPTYNGTVTTLTSSSATGNQFYFNGVAIAGATGQTYVVNGSTTTYGSYTVVVTNAFGCSSAASVVQVVTGTKGSIAGASIQLYPNPTPDGRATLELSGLRSATQLTVLDALGRVVRSETLPATTGVVTHTIDLSRMASGVYVLRLSNNEGVETRRLTRE